MSAPAFDVLVIGGGANGLVAAARLAGRGHRVLLLEAAPSVGGRSRLVEFAPGFRAAPLSVDPGWVPPQVARAVLERGLATVEEMPLSVVSGERSFLTLSGDPRAAAEAIDAHSKGDAAKWPAFTSQLRNLAGFLEELYQTPAPDVDVSGLGDLLPLLALGRKFRALGRQDMIEFLRTVPLSVWELADDWFESAPLKAAIASGGVRDVRQGPRSGGTGFVLLHHLVGAPPGSIRGRLPWRDGPETFVSAAEKAARKQGITIRTGAPVSQILVKDDAVAGVALQGGEEILAKSVLSTADPRRTFLDWIDPVWLDPEFVRAVGNIRHRGCTAFVLYALEALPDVPGLAGVVSLTPDVVSLERAADAAKYGEVPARPHVEIHAPTLLWPSLAPAGRHVLIARAHYPPYRLKGGAAWDDAGRRALEASVTAAIDAAAPGFSSRVLHHETWTPLDLSERFDFVEGSPTQGEMALDQILFMRPVAGWGRHATPIVGLYLGGCGTHPGPGVLGGAGWLAAGRMLEGR